MRRRTMPAVVVVGLVAAVLGLVPGDEATADNCFRVETEQPTSTTLGDPSCQHHDPADHVCAGSIEDPEFIICVDVS